MIHLYYDTASGVGGVETELHALSMKLLREGESFQVFVTEAEPVPLFDELEEKGIEMHRLPRFPGDRWRVRQRVLMAWLWWHLSPGDWVYSPRPPNAYLQLVRMVHRCGAKIGVRWSLAPKYRPGDDQFKTAVEETDAIISTSECTVSQFSEEYGYDGKVHVSPLHNLCLFDEPLPMPPGPPWKIGFMGRIDIEHKNLDRVLQGFTQLQEDRDVKLHFYGGGELDALSSLASRLGVRSETVFHGRYDHTEDLPEIVSDCHLFLYPSRHEGGPCFTLLELVQAGRFVVASPVGGIPDLYEGYPESGALADPDDLEGFVWEIEEALNRIEAGDIRPDAVRSRYEGTFDMESAHAAWSKVFLSKASSDHHCQEDQATTISKM
ncbi:glycosyltransferase family 4 protein [Salinibacter ruber]|uniref:glycosyltransferase family 4 protein n=1 Tax=Salinibacter ruber TaxID=146919 RepID=UPI0021670319|nr:glycosyltransferase [Salinibacter ruber]MCS3685482.1 glycosyltransferase involved in cell wall biosynthesis [Salinibacter ruber]